jgi:hypothetical protein
MLRAAELAGPLPPLPAGLKHHVLLYADDVVVFIRPEPTELAAVRSLLECFGDASGLHVNYNKSSAALIHCSKNEVAAIETHLNCTVSPLPCVYLGLPLSLKKHSKSELQIILDKLAGKLASWKSKLLTTDGRVAYAQAIMMASVIYHLMALDVDPWFIQAVDRLRRGFLWAGRPGARGGCCLVAWDKVCILNRWEASASTISKS